MDISLIVCTRNRGDRLEPCLDALAAISFAGKWELVLVDNGSSDATAEVLRSFCASGRAPARYVHEPKPGLATARNAGLSAAEGELIVFTDDDCYPEPNFLVEAKRAFEDPAVGFAGGRILLFDPTDAPVTILESRDPAYFPPHTYIRTGKIQGANMAFRRAALEQLGGFDPLFGSGSYFPAEDIDAVAGVNLLGWAGAYAPEMVVHHHHGRKSADLKSLFKQYDLGRGAYLMKLFAERGRLDWYLIGLVDNLRRAPRRPLGALREFMGGLDYLRRAKFGRI